MSAHPTAVPNATAVPASIRREAHPRSAIAELDRVSVSCDIVGDDGERIPAGAVGTVVAVWAGGAAFEVEFTEPVSDLATVPIDAIGAHVPR